MHYTLKILLPIHVHGKKVHMRDLLISDRRKIEILKALSDRKVYTYYQLSKIVGTNYNTVKKNCKFLELLNFIEISGIERDESASGLPSYKIKITEDGMNALKNIRSKM